MPKPKIQQLLLGNNVPLIILELPKRYEDYIASIDPHTLSHFASNVTKAAHAIKAVSFQAPVSQHAQHSAVL